MKHYLRERNIPFEEIDVSEDMDAARDLVRKTGQMGVPVTEINGERFIVGFDRQAIDEAIANFSKT